MGLSLNMGAGVRGSYTPLTPASAMTPSSSSSIASKAYGVSGSGQAVGPKTAGLGSVGVGMLSIGLMVFIWWSLPR